MNIRAVLAVLIAAQAAAPAWAQDLKEGSVRCFGRAYSAEHMADHPGQRVVEMTLVLFTQSYDGGESHHAIVRAMMRDRFGEFFANGAICDTAEGGFACGIECDGGVFDVDLPADGTAMLRNEDWGFVLYGGCGEDVAEDRAVRIEADAEHRAFQLYPLPVEACPAAMWQTYDEYAE